MIVFDINTVNDWRDAFDKFPEEVKEVFFTPEYYLNWQDHEEAEPMCVYAEIEGISFLYPFFIKEITGFDLDKSYYDISTAYGYGGVLCSEPELSDEIERKFNTQFNDWCVENSVVAEFIRELPYVNNQIRDARYDVVRNNVFIELTPDYIVQNRHVRKNINKAKRNGLSWEWDPDLNHLDDYVRLYSDSFKRIDMDDYYHFPDSYYTKMRELFKGEVGLVNVIYEEQIINSMIVFHSYGKMACHLIGTNYDFIEVRPNDLVYQAAIDISKELGIELISMGGGRTKDDNLFRFKEKFGNSVKDVLVGKKILNQAVYDQLNQQWIKKYPDFAGQFTSYFLRYRLNP